MGKIGVPTVAQWVKNLIAVAGVAAEVLVWSPARHSGLKEPAWLQRYDIGHSCGSDSIPGPGTSIGLRCVARKNIFLKRFKW